MEPTSENNQNSGFTLVELLVVIPMVIVIIGIIIGMMVSLVGNVLVSNAKTQTIYDTQDALSQIEQDAFLSTAFMSSYTPVSPQGKDNATQAFTGASGNNTDIIFNVFATDKNPLDSGRQIVYYANRPEPCGGTLPLNTPLSTKVIYFLKTVGSVQSLYRRTIVPVNNQNTGAPDGQTTCTKPWQRGSCETANYASSTLCATKDMKLVDNVSNMAVTYFNKSDPATTVSNPTSADSVKVKLTVQKTAAGESITQDLSISASRVNTMPTVPTPSAPLASVMSSTSLDLNNPILATFQWSAANAIYYMVSYQVGGGSWSTPQSTTNTTLSVNAGANQTVILKVTAYNDNGQSTTTQYSTTTPLFSNLALQSGWACYDGVNYYCPSFTRTSAGVIMLRGLIKDGADGTVIGYLPAGFRPQYVLGYPVLSNGNSITQVYIQTDGAVVWKNPKAVSGANGWISLDGIQFLATDTMAGLTWSGAASYPSNYWYPYTGGGGYRQDGLFFSKDSLGRAHAYGLMAGSTSNPIDYATIATVQPQFAPPAHIIVNSSDVNGTYSYIYFCSGKEILYRLNSTGLRGLTSMYYPTGSSATWVNVTPPSQWKNYGGAYAGASYTKAADNIVTLRGLLQSNIDMSSYTYFTTNSGYRPAKTMVMLTPANSAGAGLYARVDVRPNGEIALNYASVTAASNGWVSLSSISYYPDGS